MSGLNRLRQKAISHAEPFAVTLSPSLVILSGAKNLALPLRVTFAKHLQYLLENKQMQILRSAQDDSQRDFFRNL